MKLKVRKHRQDTWRVQCGDAILAQQSTYEDAARVCRFYAKYPHIAQMELGLR